MSETERAKAAIALTADTVTSSRFTEDEKRAMTAILIHAMGSYNIFVEALKTATEVQQSEKDRIQFLENIITVKKMLGE